MKKYFSNIFFLKDQKESNSDFGWYNYIKSVFTDVRPYTFSAIVTQTSTTAPVVTVLENTFGVDVVATRTGTGDYTFTATGKFTAGKTFVQVGCLNVAGGSTTHSLTGDAVRLFTFNGSNAAADALLTSTSLKIEVYK